MTEKPSDSGGSDRGAAAESRGVPFQTEKADGSNSAGARGRCGTSRCSRSIRMASWHSPAGGGQ